MMRERSTPISLATVVFGVIMLTIGATSCSDPDKPDVDNTTNNGVNCANETLSVAIGEPSVTAGFAPLTVDFAGQVSIIEPVFYTWKLEFGDGGSKEGVNSLPQATAIYNEAGDFTVALTVTDTTCNKTYGPVTTQVVVYPEVELEGEELIGRPGNVSIGESLRVSMRLLNTSENDLSVPVGVRFYLSNNAGVAWEQLPTLTALGEITVEPEDGITVAAGSRRSLDASFTIPDRVTTGAYSIIAAIDHAEHIGEGDDTRNNIVASDATVFVENDLVDAPDLTVANVQVGPSTAFQRLSSISINADLSNIGSGFATDVDYAVYLQVGDGDFDPETAVEAFRTPEPLPLLGFEAPDNVFQIRGQQIFLPEPIQLPEGGADAQIRAWIVIDPDNTIREGGPDDVEGLAEMNNVASSQGTILLSNEPQPGIDIVVIDFDFQPRATFLDGSVQITLEVANFGTEPTRSFFCSIYLSEDSTLEPAQDHRLTNLNFNNLLPTDVPTRVQQTAIVPGFFEVGQFEAFALCDASNSVPETFEDNNLARLDSPVTITADAVIDLEATSITIDSNEVPDGEDLNLSVTVCNAGTNGAGPSTLRVRLSPDASITATDRLIAEMPLDPIAPDTCRDLEIPLTALSCDIFRSEYTIGVVVDATNVVVEVNEQNNTHTLDSTIHITGDRCECADDDYEPNDSAQTCAPVTGGMLENLSVCAGGNKDYYCVQLDQGDSLEVDVNLLHSGTNTNLDLRILDPNFQQIATAISRTDGQLEQADLFLVPQQGRYIIEVAGRTANDVNEYAMNVRVSEPGPGIDLTGTNMTLSDTTPALAQQLSATFTTLNTRNDASGAYDITLWLSTNTEIDINDFDLGTLHVDNLDGARSRMDTLQFVVPVEATDGSYYVCAQFDSANSIAEADEANNVLCSQQVPIDTSCYDPFESNDTPQAATPIVPGHYENLNVCNMGRSDYYRFSIEDGQRFNARVAFTHAQGDIDLRLLLDDGNTYPEVRSSTGTSNEEVIDFDYVNGDQNYILQVFHNDPLNRDPDGTNAYTLDLVVEAADPTLRCDAVYEPNDSPDQAIASGSNLLAAVNQGIVLDRCPQTDIDFFYVDLVAGPQVEICVANDGSNPQNFNFAIALFDPSEAQLQAFTGTAPCIRQQINVTGRYFMRVLSTNRDRRAIRYNVSIDGLFGTDLVGRNLRVDPLELVPGQSFLAVDFTLQNARTQRANTVEYGLYYSATSPIINPTRDLQLLRGSIDGGLDGFAEANVSEVIIVPDDPAFVAGAGYIGVYIDPDNRVTEIDEGNNRLFSQVNVLVCEDDAFAGNRSLNTAASVSLNTTYDNLVICPGSEDFYCLGDLLPGDYRTDVTFTYGGDRARDLNLLVWDVTGAPRQIGAAVGFADNANVAFTLTQTTPVCLEVVPFDRADGSNTYSLRAYGPLNQLAGVDLAVTSADATPQVVRPGADEASLSFRLQNLNADDASNVAYQVYFSTDATIDTNTDTLVLTGSLTQLAGFSQTLVTEAITLPDEATFPDGQGYLGVVVDGFGAIAETREDNNVDAAPIFLSRCTDTGLAGNDSLGAAASLVLGTALAGQTICPTHTDWYCFEAPDAGNYRLGLDFALDGASPELSDLDVTIYRTNAQGELIDELAADHVVASGAALDFTLPDSARVCMQVVASAPFGENDYSILAEGPIVDLPPFELRPLGVNLAPTTLTPGVDTIDVEFSIDNQGTDAATDVAWALVYSADANIDLATDLVLASNTVASVAQGSPVGVTQAVAFPDDPAITPGAGFLAIVIDGDARFDEPNEADNVATRAITVVGAPPQIDLAPANLVVAPTTIEPGVTMISVEANANNHGTADAPAVTWALVYSTDDTIDLAADVILFGGNLGTIPGQGAALIQELLTVPNDARILPGQGFLAVVLDSAGAIAEADETNNTASLPVTISTSVVDIDLVAVAVGIAQMDVQPGTTVVDYTIDVRNDGADDATDVAWTLVYSADANIDATDLVLANGTLATLGAGASDSAVGTAAVPLDAAFVDGPGTIAVVLDGASAIAESDETNNTATTNVNLVVRPDAVVTDLAVSPASFDVGATVDIAFMLGNLGNTEAASIPWRLVYSPDANIDPATDLVIFEATEANVAPTEQRMVATPVVVDDDPAIINGAGFLAVVVDPANALTELDEANNTASADVTVVLCAGNDCCTLDTDCETACTDTATCNARGVCERTWRDGQACSLTCTDATVNGTCDLDRCVVDAEGPTGTAACGDNLDNDCDGNVDADDTDCTVPNTVIASAPATAPVGLAAAGAEIVVEAFNANADATGQDRNVYCTGRRLSYDFTPNDGDWIAALGDEGIDVNVFGGSDPATNVGVGVPFDDTDPDSPLGVKICNGYGVEVGPFPIAFSDVSGTYTIAAELGNPAQSPLTAGQHLLMSIRGSFSTAYHPQLAVGDGAPAALTTARVVHFGSQSSLIVRFESMAAGNDFTDNCGFVRGFKLYRTTRVSTAVTTQFTRTNWSVNNADLLSSEGFNSRAVGTTFFDQFFTGGAGAEHQRGITNGIGASSSRAAEWRSHAPGDTATAAASTLDLPAQGTLPDVQTLRQRPLIFDFWGTLNAASTFATNDAVQVLSTADGARYEPIASILPKTGLPAAYSARNDRFAVELPESAKTLAASRLRMSNDGLADPTARLYLDTLYLYFSNLHTDFVTTNTLPATDGQVAETVVVKTAEAGGHEIQCFWQVPGDPDFETIASEPVFVEFQ